MMAVLLDSSVFHMLFGRSSVGFTNVLRMNLNCVHDLCDMH